MQELAEIRVVAGIGLIVAERVRELRAGPAIDFLGSRELLVADIDDGGVGFAEGFLFLKRLGVDRFGEGEAIAARFREADDFL